MNHVWVFGEDRVGQPYVYAATMQVAIEKALKNWYIPEHVWVDDLTEKAPDSQSEYIVAEWGGMKYYISKEDIEE